MIPPLSGARLEDSAYNDGTNRWEASDLVKFAQGLPTYKLKLKYLDLSILPFTVSDILSFADHVKRVHDTDLRYPVIVGPKGNIMDGWHRVAKAVLGGKKYVLAVRLKELPPPRN